MVFEITILGTSAAMPGWGRNLSAQLVNVNQVMFLVDCGEGTQFQLLRYKQRFNRINYIFISHLHGDHYLGLTGLLSSMQLQNRTEPLHIFAPRGLDEILTVQFKYSQTLMNYPLVFHPLDTERAEVIFENENLTVSTIPLEHRIACCGFLFREKPKKRRIIKELLPEGLPAAAMIALKRGDDYLHHHQWLRNDALTLPPKHSRSYAYCSDTRYTETLIEQLQHVDLLYHEATFADDFAQRAEETWHSTARQAAQLAAKAHVRELLLGHFSVRYRDLAPLLAEAREAFANTRLATEGQTYIIEEEALNAS